ncbi:MAG: DNA-binding protein WhiA [Clostridiales bacterium]|nr:DNA-binding protein WhiA [Clostridiales bacterium]
MTDSAQQILTTIPRQSCCSHAFVGVCMLNSSEIDKKNNRIIFSAEQAVVEKLFQILNNFYSNLEINCWDSFLSVKGDLTQLLVDAEIDENYMYKFSSPCDKLTMLKSFFLTCGKFNFTKEVEKNSTGYTLEFFAKNDIIANIITTLLKEFSFEPKTTTRGSLKIIYFKNSSTICDLFVTMGATHTVLDIQNNLAMREMRNNANRQNNCFESNLDKTINASSQQVEAINYILEKYSIDYLDEKLRDVALARLANPEVSLNDLKIILNNSISRAGIKYRLDKIIEIYKKIKGEN